MFVISTAEKLTQTNLNFKVSLVYIIKDHLKRNMKISESLILREQYYEASIDFKNLSIFFISP